MIDIVTFCGLLIFSIFVAPNDGKLPPDVKPCKAGDKQCLVETINKIIETKFEGDSDLNLISIDPLKIVEMNVKQQKDSPVNVKLEFRNGEVHGYKNFRAYNVRGFGKDPEGKHEVYFKGPSASLVGEYLIDGKILILPIKGEGRSNITLNDIFLKVIINGGSKVEDGATYLDVKNVKLNLNTTGVHYELGNLFNGDKVLGESLNKFMNENWDDIYMELKGAILDAFGEVYTGFIRKVFGATPYSQLVEGGN